MAKTQEKLGLAAPPASTATVSADPVLSSFSGPWLRVVLGSPIQRTDKTSFSDPRWADQVARAIYGALGEVYGRKEGM